MFQQQKKTVYLSFIYFIEIISQYSINSLLFRMV